MNAQVAGINRNVTYTRLALVSVAKPDAEYDEDFEDFDPTCTYMLPGNNIEVETNVDIDYIATVNVITPDEDSEHGWPELVNVVVDRTGSVWIATSTRNLLLTAYEDWDRSIIISN